VWELDKEDSTRESERKRVRVRLRAGEETLLLLKSCERDNGNGISKD